MLDLWKFAQLPFRQFICICFAANKLAIFGKPKVKSLTNNPKRKTKNRKPQTTLIDNERKNILIQSRNALNNAILWKWRFFLFCSLVLLMWHGLSLHAQTSASADCILWNFILKFAPRTFQMHTMTGSSKC